MQDFADWPDAPRQDAAYTRRDFVKTCTLAAAAVGLPASAGKAFAQAASVGRKPAVIWLSFQECTGCTETLLRTSQPGLAELILDLISLDYHETLLAAAGHQAEAARHASMEENAGNYVLVVDGSIPVKDGGIYCKIAGKTALEILQESAGGAAAIIAEGLCASFGGIPAAHPNPTGATPVHEIITDKPVVNLPGCPPNPYNLLGTVLQFATFGTLPELDDKGRPTFGYGRTIHEHCPRRAHFDAGRFAREFGDEGHREGYCLYMLGCKGPVTYSNCSTLQFNEVVDAWPIGTGHPCFGCYEPEVGFNVPLHQTVKIERLSPQDQFPPIFPDHGGVSTAGVAVGSLIGGAAIGAGAMAAKKLGGTRVEEEPPATPAERTPTDREV